MRFDLRSIAGWARATRPNRESRGDGTLHDQDEGEIKFTNLSTVSGSPETLQSLSHLTDNWIRHKCDAFHFDRAAQLMSAGGVVLVSMDRDRLVGQVLDGANHTVTAGIGAAGLECGCTCDQFRRQAENGKQLAEWLVCEHVVALLRHAAQRNPQPAKASTQLAAVCPITRQRLDSCRIVYQCERCQMSYSPDGWEFVRKMDRGRCCSCRARNTIHSHGAEQDG